MPTCPYCNSEVTELPESPNLTRKQRAVYEMIASNGVLGTDRQLIVDLHFKGKSPITLRTCIARINKAISPRHIRSKEKFFYLAVD